MSSTEVILDARGEQCPVPSLKVEQFLKAHPGHGPFSVLVDHRASVESLEVIAALYGWQLEVEESRGEWCVRFVAGSRP
jgi:TusA-related sulfurtransferase